MIHVYYGDGKGKTSAAIGLAVRAAGAGKKVLFTQFMKGIISSEIGVLESIPGIDVLVVGKQFGFYRDMGQEQKTAITRRHNEILLEIERRMRTGKAEVVIVDEITSAYRYQLVEKELVQKVLYLAKEKRGRGGSAGAIERAEGTEEVERIEETERAERAETDIELVLTGRNPDKGFLEAADYITEMRMERHPYEKGIPARKGIEW